MKPHETFLQLAAISIDFPLDATERRRLDEHLRACPTCAHSASMLRQDAVALTHLPPVTLPQRRGVEILSAALHPAPVRVTGRILAIAVMLGLLLMGTLAVGAGLLQLLSDDDLSVVVPPSLEASVPPGVDASPPASSPMPGGPSGTLAVTRVENGTRWTELAAMDGASTRLAEGRDPAWLSPDRLVYTCPAAGAEGEMQTGICAIDVSPPGQPQLLVAGADHPAPAPDGRLIAFHRGMVDVGETWVMDADGANPRLLHSGSLLRWSPDGAWLAGQPESANVEIAVVGVDGQGFQVLAPGYDPVWSATGDRITYAVVDEAGASIRNIFPHDGEIEPLVTEPADTSLSKPTWVANGRRLYVRNGDLWMFDSAESRTLQVTEGLEIPGGPASDLLAPSPDGAWVAFTNGAGDASRVELVRYDGSDRTTLPWTGPVMQPAWAPAAMPASTPSPDASASASPAPELLGTTWVDAQMPVVVGQPVGTVEAVTAGGPGFVAVGRGCLNTGADLPTCEGVAWTSVDGTAWKRSPAQDSTDTGAYFASSGPEIGMFEVAAGDPGIVAIGYAARPKMAATVWFSQDDGVTWERVTIGDASSTRVNAITWDGSRFVMVGEDRSEWNGTLKGMAKATARATVWTSTDGYTFEQVPHTASLEVGDFLDTMEDPMTGGMTDVVMGPAGLVAVGSVCTAEPRGCVPMAWTSPDGIAWERATAMYAGGDQAEYTSGLAAVAGSDTGYVALADGFVLVSADGHTWERTMLTGGLLDVTTVGTRFFATESCLNGYDVLVSDDGTNWNWPDPGPVVGDRIPGSACVPVEWHFASRPGVAVAVGPESETGESRAMVSVGE